MNRILKRLNKKASFKRTAKASFRRVANNVDDFIQECENSGRFDEDQLDQIKWGLLNAKKLTIEQVKLYADPKFNWRQMQEIRYGFDDDLTMEQVKLYADPKFDWKQMKQIWAGFAFGLTMEQVKSYADPKFDADQMWEMQRELQKGLSMEYDDDEIDMSDFDSVIWACARNDYDKNKRKYDKAGIFCEEMYNRAIAELFETGYDNECEKIINQETTLLDVMQNIYLETLDELYDSVEP